MGRQLDWVCHAGCRGEVSVSTADEPLVPVDEYHPPLAVSVRIVSTASESPAPASGADCNARPKWNFYKADFPLLYSRLGSVDWSALYDIQDVDEMLKHFYGILDNVLDECVPRKSKKNNGSCPSIVFLADISCVRRTLLQAVFSPQPTIGRSFLSAIYPLLYESEHLLNRLERN
ncbi:unnamed protein product [Colias eurytheme]|nr:unnamed protein product [Colias eurytheme]